MCVAVRVLRAGGVHSRVIFPAVQHLEAVPARRLHYQHSIHQTVRERLVVLQPSHRRLLPHLALKHRVLTSWGSKAVVTRIRVEALTCVCVLVLKSVYTSAKCCVSVRVTYARCSVLPRSSWRPASRPATLTSKSICTPKLIRSIWSWNICSRIRRF